MNTKRFIVTSIVVWVVYEILSYLLNGVIIDWEGVAGVKAEMGGAGSIILGLIGGLIFSFMFSFIFIKGYEGKGIAEGLRYGLYIGLLMYVPLWFIFTAYYDYTMGIIWGFTLGNLVVAILLGIIPALLYKPLQKESKPAAG